MHARKTYQTERTQLWGERRGVADLTTGRTQVNDLSWSVSNPRRRQDTIMHACTYPNFVRVDLRRHGMLRV